MSARIWRLLRLCGRRLGAFAAETIPVGMPPFRFGGGEGAELGKREGIGYHDSFLMREYAFLLDTHKESPWRKT